jgi:hypothetical protein
MQQSFQIARPGEGKRLSVADSATALASRTIAKDFTRSFAFEHPEHKGKWREETIDRMVEHIWENVTAFLEEVIDWAEGTLGAPRVSESTLTYIHVYGWEVHHIQTSGTQSATQLSRNQGATQGCVAIAQAAYGDGDKVVALDESGVTLGLHNSHGRAPSRSDAILVGPRSAGRNESVF